MGAVCCNQQGQVFEEISEVERAGAGKGGRGHAPSPGGDAIMMMVVVIVEMVVMRSWWWWWWESVNGRNKKHKWQWYVRPFLSSLSWSWRRGGGFCQQYWPLPQSAAFARMNTWEAAEKARSAQFVASPSLASRGSEGWWSLERGAGRGGSRYEDCQRLIAPAQGEHDGSIWRFELQTWWVREQEIQLYKGVWKTKLREGLLFCPLTKCLVYHAS